MLDTTIKTQLANYLEKLVFPIELIATLDDSRTAQDISQLLRDIASLSDKISVRENGNAQHKPSFAIARTGEAARIHFAGIPMGHEFTSLVLALLQTGGYPPKVDQATIDRIKALPAGMKFETFVSLSCHNCPDVVQALNLIAVINPGIESTMIDGAVFPNDVESRQIMAVPAVFTNNAPFGNGRMSLDDILAKLVVENSDEIAAQLNAKAAFDALVVGGGPAGSAAAIYAARKGIRTGVLAERFGGQVMDTLAIENFISVSHTEGPKLATALEQHVKEYDVDVINRRRAVALTTSNGLHHLTLENGAQLSSRAIILATGAKWREMNVPGERDYRGRGVAYCPHCDGPLFKGKRVAVIGGGNSGVEAAIDLAGIVQHVTLIEFDTKLRADAVLQNKMRSLNNVTVITNAKTTEVTGDGNKVNGLRYSDRSTEKLHHIELEGVFVQIGLLPNTEWLKGVINLSARGEIEVDARGQTSLPGVFAAGDATTAPYKQIIIAMGEGAKASLSAFDYLIRQTPALTAAA